MTDLFLLCTKMYTLLSVRAFTNNSGVAMGSTIGPVLASIIMVELENTMVP